MISKIKTLTQATYLGGSGDDKAAAITTVQGK
jgi:hypothetical protein